MPGIYSEAQRQAAWDAARAEDEANARIDRFHEGYFAHRAGAPRPTDPDEADGWDQRANDCKVRVVMPRRPEGYYHAPIGTFD